jgi:N,N'-diacetyllegionaminate synthase
MDTRDGVCFLVPARKGSVRIPGKNQMTVAGIPLLARAVRLARRSARLVPRGPHAVICSVDDAELAALATEWGGEVPFLRPAHLATPEASSVDVALHALDSLARIGRTYRALVLLQPTSPLTAPGDVAAAVARFDAAPGHPPVVSITLAHPVGWHLDTIGDEIDPVRTSTRASHVLSGAIYVVAPDQLRASRRFVMPGRTLGLAIPRERSVDVDEPSDLVFAEALAQAAPVRSFDLADLRVGGDRCVLIAEAGVNHNGDVALAHRLVDAAADSGADIVKFQTFQAARLAVTGAPKAAYQEAGDGAAEDQRAMLERLTLPNAAWPALQDHARDRGLIFMSSPFDAESADLLARQAVPAFKIGSGELTNHALLRHVARFERPMLLSTGMATMVEVAAAIDVLEAAGDPPVGLFHCVSSYPARAEDSNLRAIATLRSAFGVPTGWSDHTLGLDTDLAAVAMGAELVEKHLTLDQAMPGPDHAASLEPQAFASMVAGIRAVEAARGNGAKVPAESEADVRRVARRSLHWSKDLDAGSIVAATDLVALRPGTGLPPSALDALVGRRTTRPVRTGAAAEPADVGIP